MVGSLQTSQSKCRGVVFALSALIAASAGAATCFADDFDAAREPLFGGTLGKMTVTEPGDGEFADKPALTSDSHSVATARSWILRQILGLGAADPNVRASGHAGPYKDRLSGEPTVRIKIADADPYYSLWQSHAKEKLKNEVDLSRPTASKQAADHPDSYVVVCEAGCREAPGHIVYMVTKVAAATGASRKLEPASVESPEASIASPAEPQAAVDPASLVCVAGCYDRPVPRSRTEIKKAEITPPAPAQSAVHETSAQPHSQRDVSTNAAKNRLKKFAGLRNAAKPAKTLMSKVRNGWQAKVIHEKPLEGTKIRAHGKSLEKIKRAKDQVLRHRQFSRTAMQAAH